MQVTIPQLIRNQARRIPETAAQRSKNSAGVFQPVTYRELDQHILDIAAGLLSLGIVRGDRIGLISENRKEWLHASNGIMALGCADVPRGCDASAKELEYILSFSECPAAVLENSRLLAKILPSAASLPRLKTMIFMDPVPDSDRDAAESAGFTVMQLDDLVQKGRSYREMNWGKVEQERDNGTEDEIATIIYTSGTTGEPKGVMLMHKNFTSQLPDLRNRIALKENENALCVLPVWHAYQRACEYVILNAGTALCYSKPIGAIMLADFKKLNPVLIPTVPRIWESIYEAIWRNMRKSGGIVYVLFRFFISVAKLHAQLVRRITGKRPMYKKYGIAGRFFNILMCCIPLIFLTPLKRLGHLIVFRKIHAMLGTSFRLGVSGGGALPPYIDEFFWAIGIPVLEGYGLTETAPILAVRDYRDRIFGTIGLPLDCCEIKIVDDSGNELPPKQIGSLLVKGSQVMLGYYHRPDLTEKAITQDGWFDTGDLGLKTWRGELILKGRKKDTIVLIGGENVEPSPIEMKMAQSPYIAQAVVVGQDKRMLGALVIPSKDDIEMYASQNNIAVQSYEKLLKDPQIINLIDTEIASLISVKNGFKAFERISKSVLLAKPFEVGVELSAKQEIMRYKLNSLYKKEIESIYS